MGATLREASLRNSLVGKQGFFFNFHCDAAICSIAVNYRKMMLTVHFPTSHHQSDSDISAAAMSRREVWNGDVTIVEKMISSSAGAILTSTMSKERKLEERRASHVRG